MRGQRLFRIGVALLIKEHVAGRASRGHFAKINRCGVTVFGTQQHKTATAQIARLGMRHRQRVANGHGGIDGIPTLFKNIHPHLSGKRIHGGHHPLLRTHGMEHILLNTV